MDLLLTRHHHCEVMQLDVPSTKDFMNDCDLDVPGRQVEIETRKFSVPPVTSVWLCSKRCAGI